MTADHHSFQPGDAEPIRPFSRDERAAFNQRFREVQERRGERMPKARLNRRTKRKRGEW